MLLSAAVRCWSLLLAPGQVTRLPPSNSHLGPLLLLQISASKLRTPRSNYCKVHCTRTSTASDICSILVMCPRKASISLLCCSLGFWPAVNSTPLSRHDASHSFPTRSQHCAAPKAYRASRPGALGRALCYQSRARCQLRPSRCSTSRAIVCVRARYVLRRSDVV
jgi:hypothetical protein